MTKLNNHQKGFTIIEVVLVLAIAALIFLMIFIALPALQASQRDTSRKQDASIVASAVTSYTSGERASLTPAGQTKLQSYIDKMDIYDKANVQVKVASGTPESALPPADTIWVYTNAKCEGSNATRVTSTRNSAVVVTLDNGKNTYCVDAS